MVNSDMRVEGTIILDDAADHRQVRVRFHRSSTAKLQQDNITGQKQNNQFTGKYMPKVNKLVSSSSEDEHVYVIGNVHGDMRHPRSAVTVNGQCVELLIDSGSNVNLLDKFTFDRIGTNLILRAVTKKIHSYGSNEPLPVLWKVTADVVSGKKLISATFYIVEGIHGCLLGYDTCTELGLLHITNAVSSTLVENHIASQYPELFEGLGKLNGTKIKLHSDTEVKPTSQSHRRIPFHMRRKVEEEPVRLEKLDIIETVHDPTPWVSPIVAVPKPKSPNEVRICVDMRVSNKAIQRERHITPTMDDILCDLNGATVFSKLDLNNGYHQLELDPASRYITTFSTHCGLRRYKRLNFGINSAAEIFKNAIRNCVQGIEGSINISDDILIFGRNQEAHDKSLTAVFVRLREKGLTLNKCVFNKSTLDFFGHIFSANDVSPDPNKVQGIKRAESPKGPKEVRSLLSLTNYCTRYIPGLASITEPLRDLTKNDRAWNWTSIHDRRTEQTKGCTVTSRQCILRCEQGHVTDR